MKYTIEYHSDIEDDMYNPQNEMYQFSKRNVHFFGRRLSGAKVIKNTDRQGAYPYFFVYTYYIE